MTFDLISGLHMRIQTWHPPLRLCIHAKYYVKSCLTNVLKNANKTKNMHLFSIRIANYQKILTSKLHVSGNCICLSCLLHAYMYVFAYIIDIRIWVPHCRRDF